MLNGMLNNLYSNKIRPKMEGNIEEPIYIVKEEAIGFIENVKFLHNVLIKLLITIIASLIFLISFSIDVKIGIVSIIIMGMCLSYYKKKGIYILVKSSEFYIKRNYISIIELAKDKKNLIINSSIIKNCKKYIVLICNLLIIGAMLGFNIIIKVCILATFIGLLKEIYITINKGLIKKI